MSLAEKLTDFRDPLRKAFRDVTTIAVRITRKDAPAFANAVVSELVDCFKAAPKTIAEDLRLMLGVMGASTDATSKLQLAPVRSNPHHSSDPKGYNR